MKAARDLLSSIICPISIP